MQSHTTSPTHDPAPTIHAATERGAPLWRRFAALVYDLLILAALSMFYGAATILVYVLVTGDQGEAYTPMLEGPSFQLGWLGVILTFYCYFWLRGGQTLGMRAWRLQLQGRDNPRVSLKQCLLRSLSGPFALGLGGVGYWWAWFDQHKDCLHDRMSRTQVVVLRKK